MICFARYAVIYYTEAGHYENWWGRPLQPCELRPPSIYWE